MFKSIKKAFKGIGRVFKGEGLKQALLTAGLMAAAFYTGGAALGAGAAVGSTTAAGTAAGSAGAAAGSAATAAGASSVGAMASAAHAGGMSAMTAAGTTIASSAVGGYQSGYAAEKQQQAMSEAEEKSKAIRMGQDLIRKRALIAEQTSLSARRNVATNTRNNLQGLSQSGKLGGTTEQLGG